jgi:hypothetical protein
LPAFALKFYCIFYAAAFVLGAIFWYKFAKFCCRKNHKKLFAQNLLCFGAKKVGEINPYWQQ